MNSPPGFKKCNIHIKIKNKNYKERRDSNKFCLTGAKSVRNDVKRKIAQPSRLYKLTSIVDNYGTLHCA